ncbi:MAG TPA: hypothetical protein VEK15_32215 [Vicinamibacteria bacterium]|nr:hypothetical protein [Vicinamibacteria bacterium]
MFTRTLRKSAKAASIIALLFLLRLMVGTVVGADPLSLFAKHLIQVAILWPVVFILVTPLVFVHVYLTTDTRSESEDINAADEEVLVDEDGDTVEPDGRPSFDLSDPDAVAYCPACGAGYGRNADRCVECDMELLPRAEVEKRVARDQPQKELGTTISLCTLANAEAWLLAAELKQAGIPFFTKEHGILGINFAGVKLPAVEFVVPMEKVEGARRVLSDIEEREELPVDEDDIVEPNGRPRFDLSDPDAVAYCPACGAGYGHNGDRCVDCDMELLPRAEVEKWVARDER